MNLASILAFVERGNVAQALPTEELACIDIIDAIFNHCIRAYGPGAQAQPYVGASLGAGDNGHN